MWDDSKYSGLGAVRCWGKILIEFASSRDICITVTARSALSRLTFKARYYMFPLSQLQNKWANIAIEKRPTTFLKIAATKSCLQCWQSHCLSSSFQLLFCDSLITNTCAEVAIASLQNSIPQILSEIQRHLSVCWLVKNMLTVVCLENSQFGPLWYCVALIKSVIIQCLFSFHV